MKWNTTEILCIMLGTNVHERRVCSECFKQKRDDRILRYSVFNILMYDGDVRQSDLKFCWVTEILGTLFEQLEVQQRFKTLCFDKWKSNGLHKD